VFAPKLREAGVKEETVRGILVNNPRRFLTFVPKQRLCWAHAAAAFSRRLLFKQKQKRLN